MREYSYKIDDFFIDEYTVNWDFVWSIPEFSALKDTKQSVKYHKEGNVDIHTQMVVHLIINDTRFDSNAHNRRTLIMAALCHDLGKAITTVDKGDGKFIAYGHEIESEKITRKLLWDEPTAFREQVCCLVRYHMYIRTLLEQKKSLYQSLIELSQELGQRGTTLEMLFKLMHADNEGSISDEITTRSDKIKIESLEYLAKSMGILNRNAIPCLEDLRYKQNERKCKGIKDIEILVMVGLPGAGKDTYVEEILSMNGEKNTAVICRDDIRVEMGLCTSNEKIVGTSEQEAEVTRRFNEKLQKSIENGTGLIIINNINLKKKYRVALQNDIKKYCNGKYYPIFNYMYIETTMKNHLLRRKGQISEDVFNNMIMSFDWPSKEEYHQIYLQRN